MALGSHLITVRRLEKYINDVIGKKANLPDTSKTIIGNISQINSDLTNNTGRLNTLINTNNLDRLRCLVLGANFQFNSSMQVLEFFVNLEPNVWLLIQFRPTSISYHVSTDNQQTWTKYWEK